MRAIELFAGVGGFRLGLEPSGWKVVWSNQWEPSTKRQYACECYISHFGDENFLCKDIKEVLDEVEAGILKLPDHELLVGGFPCQDYSVARTLSQAAGIQGKKGVLWWEIYRLLRIKRPKMVLCDHPGNRPSASARGRDRAGMIRGRSRRGFILNPGCALRDDNFQ
jgi:DNA (cytosine-5)-methyltransferase 1